MPSRRDVLAALGTVGVAGLAGCSGRGGRSPPLYEQFNRDDEWWPSTTHDPANSRYAPQGRVPSPPLSEAWSVPLSSAVRFPPVVDEGTVLAVGGPDERTLLAVERDGTVRWRFDTPTDDRHVVTTPPVFAGKSLGRVVTVEFSGTVRFLTREEGNVASHVDLDGQVVAPPNTSNELPRLAFVATRDGRLHAIDRTEGTVSWVHETFGGVEHAPATGYLGFGRDALVVIPTTAGLEVVTDDGAGRWRRELPWPAAGPPTMAGKRVFVGSADGVLHAFDLRTGEPLWETRVVEDVSQGGFDCPIAATPDTLYVVADDRVHAFDPAGGERRWRYAPDESEDRDGLFGPQFVGDSLLVPRRGGLTALKPGGGLGLGSVRVEQARWHADLDASIRAGTVVGGRFYALEARRDADRLVAYE